MGVHQAQGNNGASQHNERVQDFQISKGQVKGKEPMNVGLEELEFWSCLDYARSGLSQTICKSWAIYFSCNKKCHISRHCKAQWRAFKKKMQTEPNRTSNIPSVQQNQGASCSSQSNEQQGNNPLPSSQPLPNSSPTLQTNLKLSINTINRPLSSQPPQLHQPLSMAYQRAESSPFAPNGYQAMEVQHREIMARAVVRHRLMTHDEFTIVSIHPLPANVLDFVVVREVVQVFLEEHMDAWVRDIQLTHLGHA
jgi:hypothetical protein